MAINLTHTTVAVGTDAGNGEIAKAEWNEAHTITMATAKILGRTTAGTGAVEELDGPSGTIVGTTDTQTLTNKTIGDSVTVTTGTAFTTGSPGTTFFFDLGDVTVREGNGSNSGGSFTVYGPSNILGTSAQKVLQLSQTHLFAASDWEMRWTDSAGGSGPSDGFSGTPDTGIARGSAGVIKVTDGSTGLGNLELAKLVSTSNADIDIEPNGTGNVLLGNFEFDADQTVGAGQDNYILKYDDGTGLISLEAAAGGGDAQTADPLSQFAATTSAQLAGVISNETGSGALVFATSPTLVTPALGTPASGVMTNVTGTAASLTAGSVTTNANLTGHITSVGNAAVLGSFTAAQLDTAVSDDNVLWDSEVDADIKTLELPESVTIGAYHSYLNSANEAAFKAAVNLEAGTDFEAVDADILRADTADVLTAGFGTTVYDAGEFDGAGTYTPDEANGNHQRAQNGGAHTLAVPVNNCSLVIHYTNAADAGTITIAAGYTQDGDTLTTDNADEFIFYITSVHDVDHLTVKALQ
ncbi:MAG: hypothetical protein GY807_21100 [Gammaproteobacteria bacterium]|nr:hypothetical protein [Gammaproteobacteria bacterium]